MEFQTSFLFFASATLFLLAKKDFQLVHFYSCPL